MIKRKISISLGILAASFISLQVAYATNEDFRNNFPDALEGLIVKVDISELGLGNFNKTDDEDLPTLSEIEIDSHMTLEEPPIDEPMTLEELEIDSPMTLEETPISDDESESKDDTDSEESKEFSATIKDIEESKLNKINYPNMDDLFNIQPGDEVQVLPQYTGKVPDGWKFLGWNTDKDAKVGYYKCKKVNKNTALYGIWEKTTVNDEPLTNIEDNPTVIPEL